MYAPAKQREKRLKERYVMYCDKMGTGEVGGGPYEFFYIYFHLSEDVKRVSRSYRSHFYIQNCVLSSPLICSVFMKGPILCK